MADGSRLDLNELGTWFGTVGLSRTSMEQLRTMLQKDADGTSGRGSCAKAFAKLLGLHHYDWHSYEYMAPEYDQDRPEFKRVRAVFHHPVQTTPSPIDNVSSKPHPSDGVVRAPLMPVLLYGDAPTTRKNWKKITTKAWKAGSWDGILDDLELAAVDSQPGRICLETSFGRPRSGESHWRIYWIPELLKDAVFAEKKMSKMEAVERLDELLLSGIEHFWFAAGLLQGGNGSFYLDGWERTIPRRENNLRYLAEFIRWLPEFDAWWPWIHNRRGENFDPMWTVNIRNCAANAGCWIDIAQIDRVHHRSLAAAMVGAGIVEFDGVSYRLTPPTVAELIAKLDSPNAVERRVAALAIGGFGEAASPAILHLVRLTSDSDDMVRQDAVYALAELGSVARDAVPQLIALVHESGPQAVREGAVHALAQIGPEASAAVPVFVKMLQEHDLAKAVVDALSEMGPLARDAVPALRTLVEKNDAWSDMAAGALARIIGDDA